MDQAALETALQVTNLMPVIRVMGSHVQIWVIVSGVVCRTSLSTLPAWSLGLGDILDYRCEKVISVGDDVTCAATTLSQSTTILF